MKIWSDVEYVYRCLADTQRTEAFQAAIMAAVKPGDVVLDLGTGSGIMALFAARAGARKVFAVEIGDYLCRASRRVFQESEFRDRIVSLQMDARCVDLNNVEKPNVVICEMITAGMVGELQAPVINALKVAGVIDAGTTLVPAGLSTSAAAVHADFGFFGENVPFPMFADYFTRAFDRPYEVLSEEKAIHSVDFASPFGEQTRVAAEFPIRNDGCVNGLLLTSRTRFTGGTTLGNCVSYCQPLILPVTSTRVSEGDVLAIEMEYQMGQGFDSLKLEVRALSV
jgi:predicted RNA methylase